MQSIHARSIGTINSFLKKAALLCMVLCTAHTPVNAQSADNITVYIFLSETCPICQSVTLELKSLYESYHDKGISFVGLFPNQGMSTAETREKFEKKYTIPFPLVFDKGQKMVAKFAATTTPQVFVVKGNDNTILYKGRIDNSYESIGQRRAVVTQHYLRAALENIVQHKPVEAAATVPVGCYIFKNKKAI